MEKALYFYSKCVFVYFLNPPWFDKALSAVTLRREEPRVDFSWLTNPGNTIQTNPGNTIRNKYLNSDTHKYSNDTSWTSSKLNSTMCFVCLILNSQNIYRGAVIFVESQNISQLMDEKLHRKRIFDGFSPEADWALTHFQTFLSKQCKRERRWCEFFIWLKHLFGQFSVVVIIQFTGG